MIAFWKSPISELSLWLRCGIDEWHLDCMAGGELDLDRSVSTPKNHDYIAVIRRREDGKFEFSISPAQTKLFNSNAALNDYLRALGLQAMGTTL